MDLITTALKRAIDIVPTAIVYVFTSLLIFGLAVLVVAIGHYLALFIPIEV